MVTWVQLVYHIFLKTKEYSVEFILGGCTVLNMYEYT